MKSNVLITTMTMTMVMAVLGYYDPAKDDNSFVGISLFLCVCLMFGDVQLAINNKVVKTVFQKERAEVDLEVGKVAD